MSPRQNEEKVYQKYICIIRTHFRTRSQKFFNVITFMISFHLSEQITDLEERKKTLQSQLYDIFAPLSAIYRRQPFEETHFAIWINTIFYLDKYKKDVAKPTALYHCPAERNISPAAILSWGPSIFVYLSTLHDKLVNILRCICQNS